MEQKTNMSQSQTLKRSAWAVAIILIGAGIVYLFMSGTAAVAPSPSSHIATSTARESTLGAPVQYSCADGKTFVASFASSSAQVTLKGVGSVVLTHVSTNDEDGTQFANGDKTTVLWVREESAFLEQNGTTTYAACRAQ